MNRYFADISSNNPRFDAGAYARAGHVLLGNKATQGIGYTNPFWRERTHAAHVHHVSVLHYHFADGSGPAWQQARHFLNTLRDSGVWKPGLDGICLDIEQGSGLSHPVGFRQEFEDVCKARGHKRLIVYSDAGYFEEYGAGLRPGNGRLWVAAYPSLPRGWWPRTPWAHQFTQTSDVPGVGYPCDYSQMSWPAYLYHRTHRP